jgi:hypothetical protein
MTRRRRLRGKKLLIVSASIAGIAACGDDMGPPDALVANLVLPMDSGHLDASEDSGATDAGDTDAGDTDAGNMDAASSDGGDTQDAAADADVADAT